MSFSPPPLDLNGDSFLLAAHAEAKHASRRASVQPERDAFCQGPICEKEGSCRKEPALILAQAAAPVQQT